jgi:hypothetical protein
MNKWDCIKLKSLCTKQTNKQTNKTVSRIYRELTKLNLQRINIPRKKWAHELNREFSKEEV